MHRSFADWYTQVQELDASTLRLRWKAVEAVGDGLSLGQVLDLLRLFYSRPESGGAKELIRNAAKGADDLFLMDKDDAELSILAGAIIAREVMKASDLADSIALGVTCMEAEGLRHGGRLQGVVNDAYKYIADEGVRVREFRSGDFPKLTTPEFTAAIAALKSNAEVAPLAAALGVAFNALLASLTNHTNEVVAAIRGLERREETDILWWLFGGCTLDSTSDFCDMNIGEACFLGARDLSSLTRSLPGPLAARAFLKKMLEATKHGSAAKMITVQGGIDDFYGRSKLWSNPTTINLHADCCPMLFGIAKCIESGGGAWSDAFERQTGLSAEARIAPISFAFQVYNELLFLRSIDEENAS